MISTELEEALRSVEKRISPPHRPGFSARVDALETLETHVLDRLRYLREGNGSQAEWQGIESRAQELYRNLEEKNRRLFERLRLRIGSGRFTRQGLREAFLRRAGIPDSPGGYDPLDQLIGGLLHFASPPEEMAVLGKEMVAYQPTPARMILSLIEQASLGPADFFCDLGSGLGRVVVLTALLTGARARGVELEPAYCQYARECAANLGLRGVDFIQADAREAPLSGPNVFFMYTPFRGALLGKVLERLEAESQNRLIRVCTYGPCTPVVAAESWLEAEKGKEWSETEVAVFQSSGRKKA